MNNLGLEIEHLYQSDMQDIPGTLNMSSLGQECRYLVQKSNLSNQQKEYLLGFSQSLESAYQYSYSFTILSIYLTSITSLIYRLINLYHQLFLQQEEGFDLFTYLFDPFKKTQIHYPYIKDLKYRHQQLFHQTSIIDLKIFVQHTLDSIQEWDFGENRRTIIQIIFLQMLILYRTIRKNKILENFVGWSGILYQLENSNLIDAFFLFSPLIDKTLEELHTDFDDTTTDINIETLKNTLLHHTKIGEQLMIQEVKSFLAPPKEKPIDYHEISCIEAYQQFMDIHLKSSNIDSKKILFSLKLDNHAMIRDLLTLMTPFVQRPLHEEILFLEAFLEEIKKENQSQLLDVNKEELIQRISILIRILNWIRLQNEGVRGSLYLYYQKNIKFINSSQSLIQKEKELWGFNKKLQEDFIQPDEYWIMTRLTSNEQLKLPCPQVLSEICNPSMCLDCQSMQTSLKRMIPLTPEILSWLKSNQISPEHFQEQIKLFKNLLLLVESIKDEKLRNTYFSYLNTHLDIFSSLEHLQDFEVFLKNKLIEQDLDSISLPKNDEELSSLSVYLELIYESSRNIFLLDSIEERITLLRKILLLIEKTKEVSHKKLDFLTRLYHLFLVFFGYQTPIEQVLQLQNHLKTLMSIYFQTGIDETLQKNIKQIENSHLLKQSS